MNALQSIISALAENKSGHWGTVGAAGTGTSDEVFAQELGKGRQIAFLHLQAISSQRIVDVGAQESFEADTLGERLERFIAEAREDGRPLARCLISRFGELSIEGQCLVLRLSRAVRETARDVKLQTVVCGAWNFFRVQDYWKKHLANVSPVPDRKHVFFEGSVEREAVLEKLRCAGCVSHLPNRIEQVCAEALSEITGGDAFLLDYVIGVIAVQGHQLEDFEMVVSHAVDAGEITDEILRRAKRLGPGAWEILDSVVRHQFVARPERDVDAEDLRLSGFVVARQVGSYRSIALASPLLERVLRERWGQFAPGRQAVYHGTDLARPVIALNAAAYRLVAQIENTLRNLIVLMLSAADDPEWSARIQNIKTGAYTPVDDTDEHGVLLRKILELLQKTDPPNPVETIAPNPGAEEKKGGDDAAPERKIANGVVKKSKQISIIESAEDWRKRQLGCTALELSSTSLVYFLTTEDLLKSFLNKVLYQETWEPFFPKKEELGTFLEHYVMIRAAVAHNQPISLSTLKRLETMREDLEKRICHAQPRENVHGRSVSQPAAVVAPAQ